ncbi:hypothetical protein [Sporisorium scitamineum]|uniref:Uncharacterized protein n=1 Tax=Sporisorium scitamineum TaxID=49012 RepID=A0A0F7SAX1_9BASI|nr:hypothetical protein [Sporisorium scitamineum]
MVFAEAEGIYRTTPGLVQPFDCSTAGSNFGMITKPHHPDRVL